MVEEKGLSDEVADKIGEYVTLNGKIDLVNKLLQDEHLIKSKSAIEGLEAMKLILKYCEIYGTIDKVLFDLSLARGLDYYTGIIYEAILLSTCKIFMLLWYNLVVFTEGSGTKEDVHVGSIAGGGRYDNLVGMFDPKHKQVPCVGVSIGIERIFAVLEAQLSSSNSKVRTTEVELYVASAQKNLFENRMKLCQELWDGGFKVRILIKPN